MQFDKPIQDYYPEEIAICYGCGRMNPHGLHIKTDWTGEEGVCHFDPRPEHTAFPGFVYGGLLASLIDCHSIGTAIAYLYDTENRTPETLPQITCVTGNLDVKYLKPTRHGHLVLRARVVERDARKVTVACSVYADDVETVRGTVLAVQVASRLIEGGHYKRQDE